VRDEGKTNIYPETSAITSLSPRPSPLVPHPLVKLSFQIVESDKTLFWEEEWIATENQFTTTSISIHHYPNWLSPLRSVRMNLTVESIDILCFIQESWIDKSIRLRHWNSFGCGLFDRQHINYQIYYYRF
jgi:hypothetical protein